MFSRIISCDRAIELYERFRKISNGRLRNANQPLPKHLQGCFLLLFGALQKLRSELGHGARVKTVEVRNPETVERGKQQKRIFRGFAARAGLFDQCPSAQGGSLGFGSAIAFGAIVGRDRPMRAK